MQVSSRLLVTSCDIISSLFLLPLKRVPVCLLRVQALLLHDSWGLNWRGIDGEELLGSGMLRLSRNCLAPVSCTIICTPQSTALYIWPALADLISPAVDMPYLLAYTIRSSFISCSHVHVFDFLACLVSHFIFTCQALFSIKGVECTSINVVVMFSSSLPACPWNRSPFLALSSSVEGHRRFFSHATSATPAVALSLRLYSFLYSSH